MGSILYGSREILTSDRLSVAARSLLPMSAFEKEVPGSSITLNNIHHSTSTQILKVIAYAISNNFPGQGDRKEIYRWLMSLGSFSSDITRLLQDPSNQALLQGLFRLAVEEGDVQLASVLLNTGADPNANTCVEEEELPIPLRPLQYSCFHGNLELVTVLLRAGAQIDYPESGWNCSPLLFAIVGCFSDEFWGHHSLDAKANIEDAATGSVLILDADNGNNYNNNNNNGEVDDATQCSHKMKLGYKVEALLMLLHELLNAGADVNAIPEDPSDSQYSVEEWCDLTSPGDLWYPLACENHSALTLASSYRCPELVDFLIRNGANISFHIDGIRSALRECLYPSDERYNDLKDGNHKKLKDRLVVMWGGPTALSVLETAKMLIMAGVDVNDHEPCDEYCDLERDSSNINLAEICKEDFDMKCYSALDFGILTQDRGFIDALWSAGAKPTRHSFDVAIKARDYQTFCRLVESEAGFPDWAVAPDEELTVDDEHFYLESRKATTTQKKRALILAAIRIGSCADLRNLTRSSNWCGIVRDCAALREAIKQCCAEGHRDKLFDLLQSNILPQASLGSVLGSSLSRAIIMRDMELVDALLGAGASVNMTDNRSTALELAITGKHRQLVQQLLDRGAKVETQKKGNLLVNAVLSKDPDIIQLLIARASLDSLGRLGHYDKWTSPLAAAIFKGQWVIANQLLQLGASVNASDENDRPRPYETPLWAAVRGKIIWAAELLLEKGAEANDELALKAAAEDKDSGLISLLVKNLSTKQRRNNLLHVALRTALDKGRLENFHLILQSNLLDLRALPGSIHHALKSPAAHRQTFLQSLLNAGVSPNEVINGKPCLDRWGPQTTLLEAIHQQDPICVKIILETRARTNKKLPPKTAYSPLQLAAFVGNTEIVRMLLDYGLDPDSVSSCLNPDYWYAGTNICHRIGTSVQNATMEKHCEILKTLLQHGANPNATTTNCQHSALQIACREGSLDLVELLIEYGADVNMPAAEEFGATALQFAAIGGYVGIAHLLLEKGADVNAAPAEHEGRTALEGAAEHGRIDMVQLLRNAGADISESGQGQFERAVKRARDNGHIAVAKLLGSFLS